MKKTIYLVFACLMAVTLNHTAFGQKLGKFYVYSPNKAPKKVTLEYNQKRDRVKMTMPGMRGRSYWFKRNYKKTQTKLGTEKIYFCGTFNGNGKLVMFKTSDKEWYVTEEKPVDKYARKSKDCSAYKYDPSKADAMLLSKDKGVAKSMSKSKFMSTMQSKLTDYCRVISAYWEARMSRIKLPAKGMKMGNLKPRIMKAIKGRMRNWRETLKGAYIISREWKTIRNKRTGIILRRELNTVAILEYQGSCKYFYFGIREDYNGQKYGKTYCNSHAAGAKISCGKAQKMLTE